MTHQRCRCCSTVLVWVGFSKLICPRVACPDPTTIELAAEALSAAASAARAVPVDGSGKGATTTRRTA